MFREAQSLSIDNITRCFIMIRSEMRFLWHWHGTACFVCHMITPTYFSNKILSYPVFRASCVDVIASRLHPSQHRPNRCRFSKIASCFSAVFVLGVLFFSQREPGIHSEGWMGSWDGVVYVDLPSSKYTRIFRIHRRNAHFVHFERPKICAIK